MKKQVIEITESAQQAIKCILNNRPDQALRLGINNKGCSGHSYTYEVIDRSSIARFDELIDLEPSVTVVIAAESLLKLIGSTLDWQKNLFEAQFQWHNPQVKNTCGCGISVGFV